MIAENKKQIILRLLQVMARCPTLPNAYNIVCGYTACTVVKGEPFLELAQFVQAALQQDQDSVKLALKIVCELCAIPLSKL